MNWRYNPDPRIQDLERRAAQGDPGAGRELVFARYRSGTLTIDWLRSSPQAAREALLELPVGWWAQAGPEFFAFLPQHFRASLWESAKINKFVSNVGMSFVEAGEGGWFPGHNRADVCPRGHRPEDRVREGRHRFVVSFDFVEVVGTYRRVSEAGEDLVVVDAGNTDTGDDDEPFLVCSFCWASWPVDGDNWEIDYE